MNKKTIVKYIYFTILLLLPYTLVFLPLDPFIFLFIPRIFFNITTNFGIVIYYIFLMSINFFIAFKLHEIHKRESIARSTFLILLAYIVIIFIAIESRVGEGIMVLFLPLGMIIPFNPVYFFGILIYHRFINKEQKLEDGNIDK